MLVAFLVGVAVGAAVGVVFGMLAVGRARARECRECEREWSPWSKGAAERIAGQAIQIMQCRTGAPRPYRDVH